MTRTMSADAAEATRQAIRAMPRGETISTCGLTADDLRAILAGQSGEPVVLTPTPRSHP